MVNKIIYLIYRYVSVLHFKNDYERITDRNMDSRIKMYQSREGDLEVVREAMQINVKGEENWIIQMDRQNRE